MAKPAEKTATWSGGRPDKRRSRALEVDHHVCVRVRQRRIMLGLTQQQLAELIGVSYQQAHKYETGISKITAGRLYQIAQVLGIDVGYFYEEVDPQAHASYREVDPHERSPAGPLKFVAKVEGDLEA